MRRYAVSLVGIIVEPFMDYISPQSYNSVSSSGNGSEASIPTFNSEKLCLLIFVLALAFIAIISPILCLGSLFNAVQLEGLWYFWVITLSEIGYLAWLLKRKLEKK